MSLLLTSFEFKMHSDKRNITMYQHIDASASFSLLTRRYSFEEKVLEGLLVLHVSRESQTHMPTPHTFLPSETEDAGSIITR